MADNDDKRHENDIYVDYAGDVSEAELSYLTPGPTGSPESSQNGDSYVNSVMRHAAEHVQQEQEKQAQGMGQREGAAPDQRSGLTDPHRQTDQANDTRAYAHEKDEATSLSALHNDQAQRDESKVAAALKEDQAKTARAGTHERDEVSSLSALRTDQTQRDENKVASVLKEDRTQRDESTVAATLKEDQAKTKDTTRQKAEQTAERDAKAKQQQQQRGKEKQHDKGPAQGR
ncbi:MAG: hypothetical protein R3A44_30750 [Caldilineaceae bacterium]